MAARRDFTRESLAAGVRAGEKRALARAITLVENADPLAYELVREVYPETGRAYAVGVTGPPGVGKSTLISSLVGLETVGAGQGEVEVIGIADTVLLVLMPGSGDSVQALKAGIMEIPDVIAVNKMDHPAAKTMVNEVRSILSLDRESPWRPPIVLTEAVREENVPELWERMEKHRAHLEEGGRLEERRRHKPAGEGFPVA